MKSFALPLNMLLGVLLLTSFSKNTWYSSFSTPKILAGSGYLTSSKQMSDESLLADRQTLTQEPLSFAFSPSPEQPAFLATGEALDFDGANDYIALPANLTAGLNDFTFEAWLYYDGTSNWQRIMDFGSGTTVNMFLTPKSNAGKPRFAITTTGYSGEQQISSPDPLVAGNWYHIAIVLDDATTQELCTSMV